ncbi:MAG: TIGR02680 family protein, partial [Oscillospiraceae bacterium]|nr:TIGR02680 family protein [Oscillospiraceae bacterium]
MDRWVINKIGLINFWLYDEEEFSFENGKLLLRGTNGSGKSVTTQSFIPLLLDGNKRPERIDPFGKKARRMEDYLLGDGKKTDSTGYLYMELLKKEKGHVVTIGMGLRARAGGKPVDFWGFIINDGRRIGKNEQIQLYKDLDLKVPLNKNELKNLLGSGGEIYEKQEEYMSMVNRAIFGFEQISDYEHLINLLIQLRSPKLSTDFKPTVIYEILNSSLQTLSDEDLMPMATAIEHMDNMQVTLENLKKTKSSMDRLRNTYNKYNVFLLIKKAKQYRDAYDEFEKGSKKKETLSSN